MHFSNLGTTPIVPKVKLVMVQFLMLIIVVNPKLCLQIHSTSKSMLVNLNTHQNGISSSIGGSFAGGFGVFDGC